MTSSFRRSMLTAAACPDSRGGRSAASTCRHRDARHRRRAPLWLSSNAATRGPQSNEPRYVELTPTALRQTRDGSAPTVRAAQWLDHCGRSPYTYDGPSPNHLSLPACRVVPARLCTCAERQLESDVPSGVLVVVPNASEAAPPLSTTALSTTAVDDPYPCAERIAYVEDTMRTAWWRPPRRGRLRASRRLRNAVGRPFAGPVIGATRTAINRRVAASALTILRPTRTEVI
jgi:hypothetical protein